MRSALRTRLARLNVEALEDRSVPAVTATLVGDTLHVVGDSGANYVEAAWFPTQGYIQVFGLSAAPYYVQIDAYLINRVDFDMGDGDDVVTIFSNLASVISVSTGKGDDRLEVNTIFDSPVRKVNDLRIETGLGDDTVYLWGMDFSGNLSIETERGRDLVELNRVSVGGTTNIETGAGNDRVFIYVDFFGASQFNVLKGDGGQGNDDILDIGYWVSATELSFEAFENI